MAYPSMGLPLAEMAANTHPLLLCVPRYSQTVFRSPTLPSFLPPRAGRLHFALPNRATDAGLHYGENSVRGKICLSARQNL
eukprot:2251564-Rhodomonas_salina.2